ncbi:MAG TPA: hypothetical protein ACHBX0_12725 [Arsenophonus sp.]
MPQGKDCAIAKEIKGSLMERLIPLCRFYLLTDEGLYYSDSITHAS